MEQGSATPGFSHVLSERLYMRRAWAEGKVDEKALLEETTAPVVDGAAGTRNPFPEEQIGKFRRPDQRRLAIADEAMIRDFVGRGLFPSFLEAGAREWLRFDPCQVRAAIVAVGGTSPGTNAVIHSIVRRHYQYITASRAAWEAAG